jgi:hypothetical protein
MSRVALRLSLARRELPPSERFSSHPSLRSAQRAVAAGLAGLGLASVCFWGLDPGVAAELARNADSPLEFILNQASPKRVPAAPPVAVTALTPSAAPAKRKERSSVKLAAKSAVCVRLCDGYFFPTDSAAACGALCPGAATEAFFQPPGVDGIDKALSATGRKYTTLANAFRYRTSFDETCSCRGGDTANASLLALSDPTLRQGDVVMTEDGMKVFRGGGSQKGENAFIGLAKAKMPPEKRSILLAMERVSAQGAGARRPLRERTPTAAKASPRHVRTASTHWAPVAPRPAGGAHALWAQRPGFKVYDLSEAYW